MPDTTNVAAFMGTADLCVLNRYDREHGLETPEQYSHLDRFDGRTMDVAMVRERPEDCWYMPKLCCGSDYSGSLVHRSNADVLARIAHEAGVPEGLVVEVYGGYGTFAIAIRGDVDAIEVIEALGALSDYPLLDEMDHSEKEMEAQDSAWDNGGFGLRADFVRVLEKRVASDDPDVEDPEIDLAAPHVRDMVDDLFEHARERANEYWVNEQGPDMWIDVGAVADEVTDEEIAELVAASKPRG